MNRHKKLHKIVRFLNNEIYNEKYSLFKLSVLWILNFFLLAFLNYIFYQFEFIELEEPTKLTNNIIVFVFISTFLEELTFRLPLKLTLENFSIVAILNAIVFAITKEFIFLLTPIILISLLCLAKKRINPQLLKFINFFALNLLFVVIHFINIGESTEQFNIVFLFSLIIGTLIMSKVRIDYSIYHSILFHLIWNSTIFFLVVFEI